MALETFAVIGKDNAPLYLCDFTDEAERDVNLEEEIVENDCFGFFEPRPGNLNDKCSLKNQVS